MKKNCMPVKAAHRVTEQKRRGAAASMKCAVVLRHAQHRGTNLQRWFSPVDHAEKVTVKDFERYGQRPRSVAAKTHPHTGA